MTENVRIHKINNIGIWNSGKTVDKVFIEMHEAVFPQYINKCIIGE
jgi:hypothetical protein